MMDKDYLYQIDIREWIERGLDADIMVPVSGNKIDKKYDIYLQSFLLPLNEVENDMENDTYNAHTLMPGITVYGSWEDDEKVYHRWGNDNGYEPLVIKREYNGVATDSIEIVEEFRLLFNLYFNSQKNEYIDVSNGEGITVVKMNDNGYVTIHKRYLKTYLAVKEKVLMIHIDSRCVSIDNSEKIKEDGLVYRNSENTIFYALNIGNTSTGLKRKNYSIIYAKNVVSGCSLCDSNIWPYNEEKTCSSETDASEAADTDVYKNCANHDCLHSLLPPLVKKIIVVISCKVRFSRCLTAKRLAIMNLLQIVKATGDAFIARAVESVKTDAGTTVDSRVKDTNMYSMPDYTAMGDVLKNVASEGRFPGKDVVTWLRLVMDTTDKIKVHAELDIVIPHIDVNAEYTKANVMGLFKGITTKKEVVRYVFENTGIMLYAYLRGEEERREYLSGNIDINYFDYDDTHAKYSVGEIGNGMKYTIERASVVREIQAVEGSKLIFKKVLPLMGVEFVRYGMLTVVPFPFKYLREYIVKEEKSV